MPDQTHPYKVPTHKEYTCIECDVDMLLVEDTPLHWAYICPRCLWEYYMEVKT